MDLYIFFKYFEILIKNYPEEKYSKFPKMLKLAAVLYTSGFKG